MSTVNKAILPTRALILEFIDTMFSVESQEYYVEAVVREIMPTMATAFDDIGELRAKAEIWGDPRVRHGLPHSDEVQAYYEEASEEQFIQNKAVASRAFYELGLGIRDALKSAGLYDQEGTLRCAYLGMLGLDIIVAIR